MKQIININIPDNVISTKNVKKTDYIGVEFAGNIFDSNKGFVTRSDYPPVDKNSCDTGKYTIRCLYGLTIGNGWNCWDDRDFKTFLNRLVNEKTMKVYFFSSYEELVMWLIKK